jgi:hypothetical protein
MSTTTKKRFAGLSEKQQEAFGNISIGFDGRIHPATIKVLLDRKLIEESEQVLPGRFPVKIKRYAVPTHVHIAWCEWCSKNCDEVP